MSSLLSSLIQQAQDLRTLQYLTGALRFTILDYRGQVTNMSDPRLTSSPQCQARRFSSGTTFLCSRANYPTFGATHGGFAESLK